MRKAVKAPAKGGEPGRAADEAVPSIVRRRL